MQRSLESNPSTLTPPRRPYLEPLDVLHLGSLAGGDAGVEEGGRHRDTEGLGRHAGLQVRFSGVRHTLILFNASLNQWSVGQRYEKP